MATTPTDTSRVGWENRRRCRIPSSTVGVEAPVQHECREGCYWIDDPVDQVMTARIAWITPEIALGWLKRNDDNRTFSRDSARTLASEMSNGYWKENGESMIFDTEGDLIDGQHRLLGVVKSGHECLVPVIAGV